MNQKTNPTPQQLLVLIAGFCSVASVAIVALAFCLLRDISGPGMFAIAAMAAAPALMGVAMARFMTKQPPQETSSIE